MTYIQVWLGLILCVIWLLGIKLISILAHDLNNKIDMNLDSASDYSIKIENLPYNSYNEQ